MHEQVKRAAPQADAFLRSREGRRRATAYLTTSFEHIPTELLAHLMLGVAGCTAAPAMIEHALHAGWRLDPSKVTCPLRIVWGTEDRLLTWPSAAERFRTDWFPHADWVELEGVGHAPQLDVPLETAQLVLEFTALWDHLAAPASSRR
jgi:pimeloyl-ACP methyl ester carboxylesterase